MGAGMIVCRKVKVAEMFVLWESLCNFKAVIN